MTWIPPVRARLAERIIFNFRLPPHALAGFLPVSWLVPQVMNGFAVTSFCMLDLRGITIAPLPTIVGLSSISCAPRFAVLDQSAAAASPAVYVSERWTSSAFGSWFTSGFSAPHPHAPAMWLRDGDNLNVDIASATRGQVVSARVRDTDKVCSEVFESSEAYAAFIASAVSSYGLSRYPGRFTKVDLHKSDNTYTPLEVDALDGPYIREWRAVGAVLDSAFRTTGGRYEWTYHGLTTASISSDTPPVPLGRIA